MSEGWAVRGCSIKNSVGMPVGASGCTTFSRTLSALVVHTWWGKCVSVKFKCKYKAGASGTHLRTTGVGGGGALSCCFSTQKKRRRCTVLPGASLCACRGQTLPLIGDLPLPGTPPRLSCWQTGTSGGVTHSARFGNTRALCSVCVLHHTKHALPRSFLSTCAWPASGWVFHETTCTQQSPHEKGGGGAGGGWRRLLAQDQIQDTT